MKMAGHALLDISDAKKPTTLLCMLLAAVINSTLRRVSL